MSQKAHKRRRQQERASGHIAPAQTPQIQLQNPVSQHFEAFIVGNAQYCDRVVEQDSAKGQHLVLCGAGPSLAENAAEYCNAADQLWGCNSAVTWLIDNGYRPTHAFTVDQTAEMCREWVTAPDVEYLIASTVHPHLVEYLLSKERTLRFFHNFVGIKKPPVAWPDDDGVNRVMAYEDWMYCTLYEGTVRAGSGLNTVTRAIDVALFMGFETITVLGADCCLRIKSRPPAGVAPNSPEHMRWLREETIMHADGGNALASNATPLTLGGEIDGRYWETKADLIISARWLTELERQWPGRVLLVGDTLPVALRNKPDEFLNRLPTMVDSNGSPIQIVVR